MSKRQIVTFSVGPWSDKYEKQANAQGYTLGPLADTAEKVAYGLVFSHINGIIADSEYDKIMRRFIKYLVKNLTVKEEDEE